MRRALTIAAALVLVMAVRVTAAPIDDDQFYVVKLCYTGSKSVVKVLDGKQYRKLSAKMNAGGASHTLADGAKENALVPKWIILRGTFPTREAAEALLGGKKVDPKEAAAKKARVEKALLMQSLKTHHEPAKYDKERADQAKKNMKEIRDSMKTETKHKVKHYLGDPLTDKLVNTDRLVDDKPLITTDIHKLDKVKVDRKGNAITVKDGKSKDKKKD